MILDSSASTNRWRRRTSKSISATTSPINALVSPSSVSNFLFFRDDIVWA